MPLTMGQRKSAKGKSNFTCEIRRAQTGVRNSDFELLVWSPICLSSEGMCVPHALMSWVGAERLMGLSVSWDGLFHFSLLKLFHYVLFGL